MRFIRSAESKLWHDRGHRAQLSVLGLILFLSFAEGNGSKPEYRTEPVTRGDITADGNRNGYRECGDHGPGRHPGVGNDQDPLCGFQFPREKGPVIAQIDPVMFEAQVQQAQANLLLAQANLDKASTAVWIRKGPSNETRSFLPRT